MTNRIKLTPPSSIEGIVDLPTSKSITNRVLVMAALSNGKTEIIDPLYSDDTKVMITALQNIGIEIKNKDNKFVVFGNGGKFKQSKNQIHLGNAGTATRFLTAISCLIDGNNIITGDNRMIERPINQLTDALKFFGINIDCSDTGCPPVHVSQSVFKGGSYKISGKTSSQFISALLLIAPFAKQNTILTLQNAVSRPYINITIKLLKQFGITVINDNFKTITIPHSQTYKNTNITIEKDASSATYWCAMAAMSRGTITLNNISKDYIQGDIKFLELVEKMGCTVTEDYNKITIKGNKLKGLGDVDMSDIPDTVMTLAVMASIADGYTHISGVSNLRVKECDRIQVICSELKKCGVQVTEYDDGLRIEGNNTIQAATIETYNDHRIAMAFSLLSLFNKDIVIENPDCVNKSYPDYWKDLESIGFEICAI